MKHRSLIMAALLPFGFLVEHAFVADAAPPPFIGHQGRVSVGSAPFNGTGQFKFALVNGTGTTTYWSHNGSSIAGAEPTTAISLFVTNGLYSVRLGDSSVTGMTLPISSNLFATNNDVCLRVWFNDGPHGFQLLAPDQRLASVGYALAAEQITGQIASTNLAAGAVKSTNLANGAVTDAALAANSVTTAKLVNGSVTAAKLDSTIGTWKKSGGDVVYPDGNVGIGDFGPTAPTIPLTIARRNADGTMLSLGNPAVQNYAAMVFGLTSETAGQGFVQAISQTGTAYGDLWLNPQGGSVAMGNNAAVGNDLQVNRHADVGGSLAIGVPYSHGAARLHISDNSTTSTKSTMLLENTTTPGSSLEFGFASGAPFIQGQAPLPAGQNYPGPGLNINAGGGDVYICTTSGNLRTGSMGIGGWPWIPPEAPLQIIRRNQKGECLVLGGKETDTRATLLTMGLTADADGYPFLQGVSSAGISYGTLKINPAGGDLAIGSGDAHLGLNATSTAATLTVHKGNGINKGALFENSQGQKKVLIDTPGYSLEVYGEAFKNNGSPFWNVVSDRRLKTDIHPLTSSLETVDRVRVVQYRYNDQYRENHPGAAATVQFGILAQEFAEVFPDFVTTGIDGYLSVNSSPLLFVNTAAIQELHSQLRQQDQQLRERDAVIQALTQKNAELEQRFTRLETVQSANQVLEARLQALESKLSKLHPANDEVATIAH